MPLILATARREDSSIFVLSSFTRTASAAAASDLALVTALAPTDTATRDILAADSTIRMM